MMQIVCRLSQVCSQEGTATTVLIGIRVAADLDISRPTFRPSLSSAVRQPCNATS